MHQSLENFACLCGFLRITAVVQEQAWECLNISLLIDQTAAAAASRRMESNLHPIPLSDAEQVGLD